MYLAAKKVKGIKYYQLIESYRENGQVKKRVVVSLGNYEKASKRIRSEYPEFLKALEKHSELVPTPGAFDENKAIWHDVLGSQEKCFIMARIPKEIKSPFEIKKPVHSQAYQTELDLWSSYCHSIYSPQPIEKWWGKVTQLFKEYRNSGEPCLMKITRAKDGAARVPDGMIVEEYLKELNI